VLCFTFFNCELQVRSHPYANIYKKGSISEGMIMFNVGLRKLGRTERFLRTKIGMAFESTDWNKIEKSHDSQGSDVVDPTEHLNSYKPSQSYLDVIDSKLPQSSTPFGGIESGRSSKMVHDISDEQNESINSRVMTKPYHSLINQTDRSWVKNPIRGWSTMATKALYDSANLGDIIEDVKVHEHNGVPVTVHTFGKDYDTVYDLHDQSSRFQSPIQRAPDPLQIYQIAAMDFLTGNIDRHGFNLLISKNQNESGHHPLLAIDHENNFQYHKTLSDTSGTDDKYSPERNIDGRKTSKPYDYIHLSNGLHQAHRASYDDGISNFHKWWVNNSNAIKETFEKQLSMIKSKPVREHVQKNFNMRFNLIQDWSETDPESNLFDKDYSQDVSLSNMELAKPEVVQSIIGALPNDPVKAAIMIATAYDKASISVKHKLLGTYNQLLASATPEQIVKMYDKSMKLPKLAIGNTPLSVSIIYFVVQNYMESHADALLQYESTGKTGKIPLTLTKMLRTV